MRELPQNHWANFPRQVNRYFGDERDEVRRAEDFTPEERARARRESQKYND